jgi:hypothetical protein
MAQQFPGRQNSLTIAETHQQNKDASEMKQPVNKKKLSTLNAIQA